MNTIEKLPKVVNWKGKDYFLRLWVSAWGNLCIGYKAMNGGNEILTYVVEKNRDKYVPSIIEKTENSVLNEHIGNCKTLDECVEEIRKKIEELKISAE